jgi:hypothetical protein
MTYSTDGKIGVDIDAVVAGSGTSSDQGNDFELGTRSFTPDGGIVMYVHASGAIDQYDFVSIDENFEATALADAGGAAGHMIGVAQIAVADNAFAWVYVEGTNISGNILASCAADTEALWTSGTAGHVDDATSAGAVRLNGVVAVTAAAAANTNKEVIIRSARFVS